VKLRLLSYFVICHHVPGRYGPTTPFGLLYSINPAIIIIAVPFVMALTQGFDPLKQIKFGEVLVVSFSPDLSNTKRDDAHLVL
jgi:hypothetical protein